MQYHLCNYFINNMYLNEIFMSYFCSDCSYEVNYYSYSIYLFFSLTEVDCGNTVILISQTDILPIDTLPDALNK